MTTLPRLANGDNLIAKVNTIVTDIEASLTNIPGTSLAASGVDVDRLMKQRAIFVIPFNEDNLDGLANGVVVDGFEAPLVDGGANTAWTITAYSVWARNVVDSANNSLVVYKNGVSTGNSIPLTNAGADPLTSGHAVKGTFASPITFANGDEITLVYSKTANASLALDFVRVKLFATQKLVSVG